MKKKRFQKFIIYFLAVILLNIAGITGWFYLLGRIDGAKNGIMSAKSRISLNESRREDARNLEKLALGLEKEINILDSAFVTKDNIVQFIEKLEGISDITGTKLDVSFASLPSAAGESEARFRFSVEGEFGGVYGFLFMLENTEPHIFFNNADFMKKGGGEKNDLWMGRFDVGVLSSYKSI